MSCRYSYCGAHCAGVCYPGSNTRPRPTRQFTSGDGTYFWKEMKMIEQRSPTSFLVQWRGKYYIGNSADGYNPY